VGWDSAVVIATRFGLDGLGTKTQWGPRFSTPIQTGPGAHPGSHTLGTGSFLGVKRPGHGTDHPPPSSTKVKERVELYIYSPFRTLWPVLERTSTKHLLYVTDNRDSCHLLSTEVREE